MRGAARKGGPYREGSSLITFAQHDSTSRANKLPSFILQLIWGGLTFGVGALTASRRCFLIFFNPGDELLPGHFMPFFGEVYPCTKLARAS